MSYRQDYFVVINSNDKESFIKATEIEYMSGNKYPFFDFDRELPNGRLMYSRIDTKESSFVSDAFQEWRENHPHQIAWQGESSGDVGVMTEGNIEPHFAIRTIKALDEFDE